MEQVQGRVQSAVKEMMTSLDKEYFRKMQAKMYHCSAACCENPNYNMEDVGRCLQNCSSPVTQAEAFMQNELSNFQNRLQRCSMDCQDQIRDQMTTGASDAEIAKQRNKLEQCVIKCADTQIALIPTLMKRVREVLQQHK